MGAKSGLQEITLRNPFAITRPVPFGPNKLPEDNREPIGYEYEWPFATVSGDF